MGCTDLSKRMLMVVAALGLTLAGCGDDGGPGDSGSNASTGATGTDGATSSTPGTDGDTEEPGTGGGSQGTSAGTSNGETEGPTGSATEGATEGEDTTAGETEGSVCDGLGLRECMSTEGCMPIGGAPINMTDGGVCLGPREYIECQPATGCGDAITFACETPDSTMYQFLDTCIPAGWMECGPPPPIDIMPCGDGAGGG